MLSNYVCAGFETLASILERFMRSDDFNDHFTKDQIVNFFSNTCNKFLHSYGQNFGGRKSYTNYSKNEAKLFAKCRSFGFFDKSLFITDSGGFQASIGLLDRREFQILFDMYYDFVKDHSDVIDRAFILDVPPGPGCKLFDTFEDIYKVNLKSYEIARDLPDEARRKIIYIHHFRTPKLWDIYSRIMNNGDMFNYFDHHATGGIVANMTSDMDIPCIIYVIPLIPLINQALKYKRTTLDFHILGGANFRDILFYELFRLHVMKKHNLDLNITYDSSGLFKGLMVGRYIPVYDEGVVRKVDLRTECLDKRYRNEITTKDIYKRVLDDMSDQFGFKRLKVDEVYSEKTGTFLEENRIYSLLYMLNVFSQVQTSMKDEAAEMYKWYESGEIELFNDRAEDLTRNLNNGKITKKQKAKSSSIVRSLDMLTELDEEYCKYIVNKFLSKDEFISLMDERKAMII